MSPLRYICEVNLILAFLYEGHSHHEQAELWFERVQAVGAIGLTRSTQAAVLRHLNTPTLMGKLVKSGSQAWETMDRFLADDRVVLLEEPHGLDANFRGFTMNINYSPKVWPDAYPAAIAVSCSRKLVTFDRGFLNYPGLDVEILQ